MDKNRDEIILTDGSEFKKFPHTPRPQLKQDGIFPTLKEIKEYFRTKIKRNR